MAQSQDIKQEEDDYKPKDIKKRRDSVEHLNNINLLYNDDDNLIDVTPMGRPGDSEDFFVPYQQINENKHQSKIRLSRNLENLIENYDMDRKENNQSTNQSTLNNDENKAMVEEKNNNNNDDIEILINFNESSDLTNCDINKVTKSMKNVLMLNSKQNIINIITKSTKKMNEYLFINNNNSNKVNTDFINTLKNIMKESMNNYSISCSIMDIFNNLSMCKTGILSIFFLYTYKNTSYK